MALPSTLCALCLGAPTAPQRIRTDLQAASGLAQSSVPSWARPTFENAPLQQVSQPHGTHMAQPGLIQTDGQPRGPSVQEKESSTTTTSTTTAEKSIVPSWPVETLPPTSAPCSDIVMVPAVVPMMVPVGVPHVEPPRSPPISPPPCYDIGMGCFPADVCKLLTSEQCLSIPMAGQACPRSCGVCGPKPAAGPLAQPYSDRTDANGQPESSLNPQLILHPKRVPAGGLELKPSPSPISQGMAVVTPIPTPSTEPCTDDGAPGCDGGPAFPKAACKDLTPLLCSSIPVARKACRRTCGVCSTELPSPPPPPKCMDEGTCDFPAAGCKKVTWQMCHDNPMVREACHRSCGACTPAVLPWRSPTPTPTPATPAPSGVFARSPEGVEVTIALYASCADLEMVFGGVNSKGLRELLVDFIVAVVPESMCPSRSEIKHRVLCGSVIIKVSIGSGCWWRLQPEAQAEALSGTLSRITKETWAEVIRTPVELVSAASVAVVPIPFEDCPPPPPAPPPPFTPPAPSPAPPPPVPPPPNPPPPSPSPPPSPPSPLPPSPSPPPPSLPPPSLPPPSSPPRPPPHPPPSPDPPSAPPPAPPNTCDEIEARENARLMSPPRWCSSLRVDHPKDCYKYFVWEQGTHFRLCMPDDSFRVPPGCADRGIIHCDPTTGAPSPPPLGPPSSPPPASPPPSPLPDPPPPPLPPPPSPPPFPPPPLSPPPPPPPPKPPPASPPWPPQACDQVVGRTNLLRLDPPVHVCARLRIVNTQDCYKYYATSPRSYEATRYVLCGPGVDGRCADQGAIQCPLGTGSPASPPGMPPTRAGTGEPCSPVPPAVQPSSSPPPDSPLPLPPTISTPPPTLPGSPPPMKPTNPMESTHPPPPLSQPLPSPPLPAPGLPPWPLQGCEALIGRSNAFIGHSWEPVSHAACSTLTISGAECAGYYFSNFAMSKRCPIGQPGSKPCAEYTLCHPEADGCAQTAPITCAVGIGQPDPPAPPSAPPRVWHFGSPCGGCLPGETAYTDGRRDINICLPLCTLDTDAADGGSIACPQDFPPGVDPRSLVKAPFNPICTPLSADSSAGACMIHCKNIGQSCGGSMMCVDVGDGRGICAHPDGSCAGATRKV